MRFLKTLFSRWIIISLILLIQITFFCSMLMFFSSQYVYISVICEILSILTLIEILLKRDNPEHKIPWLIIVLLFPPSGLLIYLMFGKGYVSRKHKRTYQSVNDRQNDFVKENILVNQEIKQINIKYYNQSHYIYKTSKAPIFNNTEIKYLDSGEMYFKYLFNDLKKAKHFIFLEYFIFSKGKLLDELLLILKQKVKEGLDVRIIYDDIGCIKTLPYNFNKYLQSIGINCVKFNKYSPFVSVVYNNRDHRKIAIIDGYIGYTGGINIADEYINYIQKYGYWKDNGIRLFGEAVNNLTLMFLKTFDIYSNTKTNYGDYLSHKYYTNEFTSDGYIQPFGDGPAPIYDNYIGENVYLNMINQATKYIYITTPYLIVNHTLMNALENAAKRGVEVIIITPGIPDKKIVYSLTRYSYGPLVKSGVKIYEYKPGFIHAKTIIVDDEIAVVGTINFDYRSLVHHFECGCYIINNSCIKDIKEDFLNTLGQSKIPNKKVYNTRNPIKRLYLGILRFFAPLM